MASRPPSATQPLWTDDRLRDPHAVADKQRRVGDMFAAIAPSYDFNNRLHSLGTDQLWRRKAVKLSRLKPDDVVVDVACGTGDLTLAYYSQLLWERVRQSNELRSPQPGQVIGLDYTFPMLPLAVGKAGTAGFSGHTGSRATRRRLQAARKHAITYLQGDAQALPLPDACCDVVSIAFGIRNVADAMKACGEFRRVLRPGGRVVVLEFSKPTNALVRWGYNLYFNQVMTRTASWLSRDTTGAYRYLSASVETFKTRQQMTADLTAAGFVNVTAHPLTFGVAVIYLGQVA